MLFKLVMISSLPFVSLPGPWGSGLIAREVNARVDNLPGDRGTDLVLHQRPLRDLLGHSRLVERNRRGALSENRGRREHGREEGDGRSSLHRFLSRS